MISCRTIIWTINYSQTLYKLWTIVMKVEEATYILLLFIFLYIFMSGVSWSIGPSSNVILIVDNFNSIKKIINNIDLYNHILYLSEHVLQRSLSLHCRAMWTLYYFNKENFSNPRGINKGKMNLLGLDLDQ